MVVSVVITLVAALSANPHNLSLYIPFPIEGIPRDGQAPAVQYDVPPFDAQRQQLADVLLEAVNAGNGDAVGYLLDIGPTSLPMLFDLLRNANLKVASTVAENILYIGEADTAFVPVLRQAIEKDALLVRMIALHMLRCIDVKASIDVARPLLRDPSIEMRSVAVLCLNGFPDKKDNAAVIDFIKVCEDPDVKFAALVMLRPDPADKEVLRVLLETADDFPDIACHHLRHYAPTSEEARLAVLRILREQKMSAYSVPKFAPYQEEAFRAAVERVRNARANSGSGVAVEIAAQLPDSFVPELGRLLSDENAGVRRVGLEALKGRGAPAEPYVGKVVEMLKDEGMLRDAVEFLAQFPGHRDEIVPALLAQLMSQEKEGEALVKALGQLAPRDPRLAKDLLEAAAEKKIVPYHVEKLLAEWARDDAAIRGLISECIQVELAKKKEEQAGRYLDELVKMLPEAEEDAWPAILQAAKSGNSPAAVEKLWAVGPKPAKHSRMLIAFLKDPDLEVSATTALANIKPTNRKILRALMAHYESAKASQHPKRVTILLTTCRGLAKNYSESARLMPDEVPALLIEAIETAYGRQKPVPGQGLELTPGEEAVAPAGSAFAAHLAKALEQKPSVKILDAVSNIPGFQTPEMAAVVKPLLWKPSFIGDGARGVLWSMGRLEEALPEFIKMIESGDPAVQVIGVDGVRSLGAKGKPAIPVILREIEFPEAGSVTDPPVLAATLALSALRWMGPEAKEAVPWLLDVASNGGRYSGNAARALVWILSDPPGSADKRPPLRAGEQYW